MQISGSRVMITGASGGLGGAIARELSRRGADIVLTARSAEVLASLASELGGEVVVADLSSRADVERLCAMLDGVDVLVANAGIGDSSSGVLDVGSEQIDRVIDVNLRAPIVMSTEFARRRTAAGRAGQIVLVGSLSGLAASPETRLYNATKFGLRGFSLSLRQDLAEHGIGVSLVSPGFIHTAGMFADNDIELPRFVRTKGPDDVAAGVVRAIESDPAEVFVAPLELRASATFATVAPGVSEIIQRRLGVADRARGR